MLPLNIVLRTGRKRLRERAWKILKDAPTQLGPVVSFCEIIISQEGLGKGGIVLKPFNVMLRTDRILREWGWDPLGTPPSMKERNQIVETFQISIHPVTSEWESSLY